MSTYQLLKLCLTFHLIGLALAAGMMLAALVAFSRNRQRGELADFALAQFGLAFRFLQLAGAGVGLLLLSGVGMMHITEGVFAGQLWFQLKMGLVLLVGFNAWLGIRLFNKGHLVTVRGEIAAGTAGKRADFFAQANAFYVGQLLLFFLIFLLASFRPQ